jgi:D-xylose 1-dehydrogenase (NADP+, D-xylono-1,5-lactone-forming)
MKKLKAAVFGTGFMGRVHTEGIRRLGNVEVAAIAASSDEKARKFGDEVGVARTTGDYRTLLNDPEIDAVHIFTPNSLHFPMAKAAMEAGKHVLCEKPLARDVAEAEEMVGACRHYNVILMEAFMWRHHPRVAQARRWIAEGRLGELRIVKMDFSFDVDRDDWRLDPRRGGGAMFDLGCYGINAGRLFTGAEPLEVLARARFHASGVDMTTALSLRFPGDVLAVLDCSFECPYRNRFELVGTHATIELPGGVLPDAEAECILRSGQATESSAFAADQYAEQIKAFCQAIATGRLSDPAENGLANMRVLAAAKASAGATGA